MSLIRPALDARRVTPSAVSSESLATHALKKRLTFDELAKGIALDSGKVIPVSWILALFQSIVPFPKPANSDSPPPQQQLPQPGVPSPQNPTGGYYPGAPINQESPGQTQVTPQSYYDPRINSQVSYQDPRLQDPRYLAALQQQAQEIASAGGPQPPQDSQPVQAFGRTEADFSQMTPQGNWLSQSQRWVCGRTNPPLWISANALQTTLGDQIKFEILHATPRNLDRSILSRTEAPLHPNAGYPIDLPFCFGGGVSLIFLRGGVGGEEGSERACKQRTVMMSFLDFHMYQPQHAPNETNALRFSLSYLKHKASTYTYKADDYYQHRIWNANIPTYHELYLLVCFLAWIHLP